MDDTGEGVRLGELELGGNAVGTEAGLEELADGLRGTGTSELEMLVSVLMFFSSRGGEREEEATYNKLAGDVADLPAGGALSAGVGAGGATLGLVGGGSSEGGQSGDDGDGDLHDDGLVVWSE